MSPVLRRHAASAPAPAEVNELIRRLMDQPSSSARSEEYVRLLLLWTEAT
jgi:hypothetical protein